MPTATDLVTDLPADFEVFGQAVATDLADLLGGPSGYILSKASATDMDFAWIANDQGDITGITATTPLTGGGSSGAVTVGIQDALTTQKGAVQLSDSTSTTSSILAATPTAVKSAYDLADAAIAKTTVTTAGDLIYRNATVPVRLGIGTVGQVLTVNSGATAPEWTTPAGGGGKVLQVVQGITTTRVDIATTTFTDTSLTATITPTLATSKILVLTNQQAVTFRATNEAQCRIRLLRNSTVIFNDASTGMSIAAYGQGLGQIETAQYFNMNFLDSPATTSATTYKTQGRVELTANSADLSFNKTSNTGTIILMEIGA